MGYAYCPRCHKAIRFRATAADGPAWLKDVARSLGRGEPPVLYCIACWLVPEVGDLVAVLDPPYDVLGLTKGSVGRVVEAEGQAPFRGRFVVEFSGDDASPSCRHMFYAHQIQAAGIDSSTSLPIQFTSRPDDDV
jgi:hypothetical protein